MAGDDFAICRGRIHSAVPAAESKKGGAQYYYVVHVMCVYSCRAGERSAHIASSLLATYILVLAS